MSDPNHFFAGRNLEEDTKAFNQAIHRPHDVEYSLHDLISIRDAFSKFPDRTKEETDKKVAMIAKTNEFIAEIMHKKKKRRDSISKLDRLD